MIRSPNYNPSSLLFNLPGVVQSAPITIGITVSFNFHSFVLFSGKFLVIVSFSFSLIFTLWSAWTVIQWHVLFSFLFNYNMVWSPENFRGPIPCDWFLFVHKPFGRMVKFQFLAQLLVDHLPNQLCPVLYSLCASLPHSLIIWSIVSFLSPHSQNLLSCYILSVFVFI